MTISIYKDSPANAIFIEDANGVQFLNSLQAVKENPSDSTINITDLAREIFVYYQIEFDQFVDETGSVYGANATEVCNALNAIFLTAGSASDSPVITSSTSVSLTVGDTLNYELTSTGGVGYEWDNLPSGILTVEGNVRKLIGGSTLSAGTYTPTMRAVNYFGVDERLLTITVSSPPFSDTKSVNFVNQDYLNAAASSANPFYRASNGAGSGDAWSVSFWLKGGTSNNQNQTIAGFGGNDVNNEGQVWIRYNGQGGSSDRIVLQYGTDNNRLILETPAGSVSPQVWEHWLITYDGGTTGSASGSLSSYYGRFTFYKNGVAQTTTNSHNNYGWSGSIPAELFFVGRRPGSGNYMRNNCRVDEFALWGSDQSSNAASIYNSGTPHDLSLLGNPPVHWWRMGDGDTFPTIQDNVGSLDFTMNNMTAADIVSDTP